MVVGDFALELDIPVTELIKKLMSLGVMASMNTNLSFDDASLLALEYNKTLKIGSALKKYCYLKFNDFFTKGAYI